MADTSWIKPGKVAWDWWNALNIYGVPFTSGVNTDTYTHYIDFAAEHGIEYIILDEGWYTLGDLLSITPGVDMEAIAAHAKQKNVGLIMWVVWKTFDLQMGPALDQFEKWGVKGIKVDFMQREDQWMVNYYERVAREAAQRKLLVDFHGAYKPTGLYRTWPNVVTSEGVLGLEQSKWGDLASPDNAVTFPFMSMLAGPVDYTPGAMINAAKKDFQPIFGRPMSQGTRCQQLAMYVVFESPLQMLADSPSNYRREPESLAFLAAVPTVWDETRVLSATVGEHILVARRRGREWYVGALTNWDARDLDVDLSFLGAGRSWPTPTATARTPNASVSTTRAKRSPSRPADRLRIHLAPGGGWVARITPRCLPRTARSSTLRSAGPGCLPNCTSPARARTELASRRTTGRSRTGPHGAQSGLRQRDSCKRAEAPCATSSRLPACSRSRSAPSRCGRETSSRPRLSRKARRRGRLPPSRSGPRASRASSKGAVPKRSSRASCATSTNRPSRRTCRRRARPTARR